MNEPPLPPGWVWCPLRRLGRFRAGSALTGEGIDPQAGETPVFGGNGQRGFTDGFTHEGTFALIGRQGALCGNVNVARGRFWATEHAVVMSPTVVAPIGWLSRLLEWADLGRLSQSAAQPGIAVDDILGVEVPLPPEDARAAIADFLDRETAQIDVMIEAQRVLTSRIDERRLAIITEMVTGGTGSRGSERQPGSEWIGEIPTHWEVAQVRRLGDLHTGSTPVGEESALFSDDSADTPWVRPENLGSRQVSGRGLGEEGLRQLRCVPAGSVLICGIGATVSKVGQSDRPVATNQQITAWVHDLDPAFAYYAMMAAKPGLLAATVGNTLPILNNLRLGGVTIPLPPLAEQVAIGSKLDDVTRVMDDMIEAANDAVALMRERRSALISAAVTGRIDPHTGQEFRPEMVLEPA